MPLHRASCRAVSFCVGRPRSEGEGVSNTAFIPYSQYGESNDHRRERVLFLATKPTRGSPSPDALVWCRMQWSAPHRANGPGTKQGRPQRNPPENGFAFRLAPSHHRPLRRGGIQRSHQTPHLEEVDGLGGLGGVEQRGVVLRQHLLLHVPPALRRVPHGPHEDTPPDPQSNNEWSKKGPQRPEAT